MFGYDQPTPFDVRFRLFGFPVRVHPLFWLIMALLGEPFWHGAGFEYLFLWLGCGFFSILLHELAHAFFIRYFGSPSAIVLTGWGGYAENPYPPHSPWKRLAISLAGPFAQLAFVALLFGSDIVLDWSSRSISSRLAFNYLLFMNLFWAVLNLLPIYPLDGGMAAQQIFRILRLKNPDSAVHMLSMIVSGVLVLRGLSDLLNLRLPIIDDVLPWWLRPSLMMTFWFAMYIMMNYQLWQIAQRQGRYDCEDPYDDSRPWRR